jgi:hypothetical protein
MLDDYRRTTTPAALRDQQIYDADGQDLVRQKSEDAHRRRPAGGPPSAATTVTWVRGVAPG